MPLSTIQPFTTLSSYGTSANSTSANELIDIQPDIIEWDVDYKGSVLYIFECVANNNVNIYDLSIRQGTGEYCLELNDNSLIQNIKFNTFVSGEGELTLLRTSSDSVSASELDIETDSYVIFDGNFKPSNELDGRTMYLNNLNHQIYKNSSNTEINNLNIDLYNASVMLFDSSENINVNNLNISGEYGGLIITDKESSNITIDNLTIPEKFGIVFDAQYAVKGIHLNTTAASGAWSFNSILKSWSIMWTTEAWSSMWLGLCTPHNNTLYVSYTVGIYIYYPVSNTYTIDYTISGSHSSTWTYTIPHVYDNNIYYNGSNVASYYRCALYNMNEQIKTNRNDSGHYTSGTGNMSGVGVEASVFLIGGNLLDGKHTKHDIIPDVYTALSENTGTWSTTYPYYYFMPVNHNNENYFFGDYYRIPYDESYKYNTIGDTWSTIKNHPINSASKRYTTYDFGSFVHLASNSVNTYESVTYDYDTDTYNNINEPTSTLAQIHSNHTFNGTFI